MDDAPETPEVATPGSPAELDWLFEKSMASIEAYGKVSSIGAGAFVLCISVSILMNVGAISGVDIHAGVAGVTFTNGIQLRIFTFIVAIVLLAWTVYAASFARFMAQSIEYFVENGVEKAVAVKRHAEWQIDNTKQFEVSRIVGLIVAALSAALLVVGAVTLVASTISPPAATQVGS